MKKLITLLMIVALLAGCSGKKETHAKEEPKKEETESVESFDLAKDICGTWRTCAVSVKDVRFSADQIEAMGGKDSIDVIFVINKDGKLYIYTAYDDSINEVTWSAGKDNSYIIAQGKELPIVDGEILLETSEGTVYLEKISDKEDKEIIDELSKEEPKDTIEESESEPVQPEIQEEVKEETSSDSIRPEVKEAIDAYESFIDEYCEFMKKYSESGGTDFSILTDYFTFVSKLEEYSNKMDAMEDDLTDAEYWYYIEVLNRCNEKMLRAVS